MEMIMTPDGEVPLDTLGKIETRETLPCGEGITTEYLYQGMVVRKDYQVIVSPEAFAAGMQAATQL